MENRKRAHYLPEWKRRGKIIRSYRLTREITAQEMAERLGVGLQYYNHLEQGYNNPLALPLPAKQAFAKAVKAKFKDVWETD
jgi:transcriptional regulator with XRE-family HTH domain